MKKILTKNEPLGLHFILRQRVYTLGRVLMQTNEWMQTLGFHTIVTSPFVYFFIISFMCRSSYFVNSFFKKTMPLIHQLQIIYEVFKKIA